MTSFNGVWYGMGMYSYVYEGNGYKCGELKGRIKWVLLVVLGYELYSLKGVGL